MNLIQQAVERASHLEQQGKLVLPPLPAGPRHPPTNLARIQPAREGHFSPMLGIAMVAALALGAGVLLYVFLVKAQGLADQHPLATAPAPKPAATHLVEAVRPITPAPEVAQAVASDAAQAPVTAVIAPAVPVASALAAVPAAEAAATVSEDEIRGLVERWARAWSERDVPTYLALYGNAFAPDKGLSRPAWEKSRRQAIQRRNRIAVTVSDLRLENVAQDRISVRFMQDYSADDYRETAVPKRLLMAREADGWRIVAETSEAARLAGL